MTRCDVMKKYNQAIAQAVEVAHRANVLMRNTLRSGFCCNPKFVHRIFLFETEDGIDYGFARDEFGELEPFFSVKIYPPKDSGNREI